jgi:hypothetical protein
VVKTSKPQEVICHDDTIEEILGNLLHRPVESTVDCCRSREAENDLTRTPEAKPATGTYQDSSVLFDALYRS